MIREGIVVVKCVVMFSVILAAFEEFRVLKEEPFRFYTIVEALNADNSPLEMKVFCMMCCALWQVACLSFINIIINSGDDLNQRVSLRDEFFRLDIIKVLKQLTKSYPNEEMVTTQLQVFYEEEACYYCWFGWHLDTW